MSNAARTQPVDLVLEGGGVKGVAFGGVLEVLDEHGYRSERVAGTSSGAITAALLVALTRAGESVATLRALVDTLDLTRFADSNRVGRLLGPFARLAEVGSLVLRGGLHEGAYLENWLTGVLGDLGVRTFGDLRRDDPGSSLPIEHSHALVVATSDLSRRRMTLLPWDFARYGLEPDEQSVARAVRASAAIPFYFRPVEYATPRGNVSLVDGGFLSNYPITVFDHPDRSEARWPTIGVRLSARENDRVGKGPQEPWQPVKNVVQVGLAVVDTAIHGIDARHIDDPETIARTIFVDAGAVRATNFALTDRERAELVGRGRQAAVKWLSGA